MMFTFASSSVSFSGRPTLIYENGTSQPLGTDVFLYLLYIRLDPASNDAVKVPLVLLTDILSAMADQSSALFESCTESPRMLYSVKRHSTVADSPLSIFLPHPLLTICR